MKVGDILGYNEGSLKDRKTHLFQEASGPFSCTLWLEGHVFYGYKCSVSIDLLLNLNETFCKLFSEVQKVPLSMDVSAVRQNKDVIY